MAIEISSGDILTSEQLKKHARIYAGPGAGKTHFLVENVKNIITTHPFIAKSLARKVLCVTYTNAAVEEIQRRLDRFSDAVEVFTIHSFIIEHIIKPFQKDLRDLISEEFCIDVETKKPLTSQIEGLGILHGFEKEEIYSFINKCNLSEETMNYSKKAMGDIEVDTINYFANRHKDGFKISLSIPENIERRHSIPIKKFVWSVVRKLTHDEILYFGYRILERNSTALYALRVKFPFIFVDEFQDTNPLQALLLKLIGKKSTVIGVIGDIAQSIYSFQGAKPSQFSELDFDSTTSLVDYAISGNRRSTANIVGFCNYIRKSDSAVIQTSIRSYTDKAIKEIAEAKPVHFLIGDSDENKRRISEIIESGGVVLTRVWAKAFAYIKDIDAEQVKLLGSIYNHYYASPIDIRAEITEIGNITWVRAFKFIFSFYKAFMTGSLIDAIRAFGLYVDIDRHKLNLKLLRLIYALGDEVFSGLTDTQKTVDIIEYLSLKLREDNYSILKSNLLGEEFTIPIFDDYDLTSGNKRSARFIDTLSALTWTTSHKLFSDVFSVNSRYMTVHQAKGLEWDKVIVSVEPNSFDKTQLSVVYSSPHILDETSADEFVRMYYVACSRAKEDLYIHLPSGFNPLLISNCCQSMEICYEVLE
jgi:superfamily I DNA/RNA helicase